MPLSQQIQPVINFATSITVMAGVAAMVGGVAAGIADEGTPHHSIPLEAKKPLIDRYGLWAVNRAEALCPENDVACVEREAKRMAEVIKHRR